MSAPRPLPRLPFDRPHALAVPPMVRALQREAAIARVRTPAGDDAWYVTRHAEVRQLLGDARLGRSHPEPQSAPRVSDSIWCGGPVDRYDTEAADHARTRALLAPCFSARRMEALRPRVEALVDELLDAMAGAPPADLHEALSFPLPALVICELLGVPAGDRELFRAWSRDIAGLHDRARASASLADLNGYMDRLVARRRARPRDDVVSELCAAGGLDDGEVARLAAVLLFAGHETTAVRIDLGVALLLVHPEQWATLRRDPTLLESASEEVLRASGTGGAGVPRYARCDVEIGGVTVRAGDAVLLDRGAANHDERVFADPDRFDVTRRPNPHLAFGHGSRFCAGAPLAKIELRAALGRLAARLPTLRLAVPPERLRARDDALTGGLAELPVTW